MSRNTVYVGNIYSNATDEQVKGLLETIGPLVRWEPKYHHSSYFRRDGEVKFSAIAEYADYYTAEIAVRNLNGYKFQNRDLKVKLHGSSGPLQTRKQLCVYLHSETQLPSFEQVEHGQYSLEELFAKLSVEKKLALLWDLKGCFASNMPKLYHLLLEKPQFTQLLAKALDDVKRKYPPDQFVQPPPPPAPVYPEQQAPPPPPYFPNFTPQAYAPPMPQYMYQPTGPYIFPRKPQ